MAKVKPRLKLQKTATVGEVITIKALVAHPMETGQRKDREGKVIPRSIVNKFTCEFNGKQVFAWELEPSVSANPYIQFTVKIKEPGTLKFNWTDDEGTTTTTERKIEISG